jgi:hypothetical protein
MTKDSSSIKSFREKIVEIINLKENESNFNLRFNMDMFIRFQIFNSYELEILKINGINNLQELIDCDLRSLIGMNEAIYEKLDWARKFYDMRGFTKKDRGINYEKQKR